MSERQISETRQSEAEGIRVIGIVMIAESVEVDVVIQG